MSLILPDSLCSRRDVARLRTEVELYAAWTHQYSLAERRKIRYSQDQPDLSEAARIVIRQWLESGQSTAELLQQLRTIEAQAPAITITLAQPPTADTRRELVRWCRRELAADMLVTIIWSSQLLGGMIVRTDRGLHDWSHRRRLRQARPRLIERLAHAR